MRKIITFGVYDYFHLGHLRLFKQCKEYADYLIVAVQNEEFILKFKPDANILYSTDERIELLEALQIVVQTYRLHDPPLVPEYQNQYSQESQEILYHKQ